MSELGREKRGPAIVPGVFLLLLGVWLLGRELGFSLFLGRTVWPWLIVLLGIVIWVKYIFFAPRCADDVFWGTAAILAGGFLAMWHNGWLLAEMDGWGELWPVIPLVIGVSSIVQWVFSIRNWGALVFGVAAGAAGGVGLAYTSRMINTLQALQIANLWPALLIVAGLGLLVQAFMGRRTDH